MRAAVLLRNVVGEAKDVLLVGVVPLHRHLDRDAVLYGVVAEEIRVKDILRAIHVLDEALDAAREREVLLLAGALVDEDDAHPVVQERELAQPPRQDVVVIVDVAEDFLRSEEVHFGAAPLGRAGDLQSLDRGAAMELHLVHLAVAPDGEP